MKYVLTSSLEHRVLFKIAITLWDQNDIRRLISELSFLLDSVDESWKQVEAKVLEKVPQLSLPPVLKEKLLGSVKTISLQILDCMKFHCNEYLDIDLQEDLYLPAKICWTQQGTVDRSKTAEKLIKDQNLDILQHYKLACIYCLEENVQNLWNTMHEDLRKTLVAAVQVLNSYQLVPIYQHNTVSLWTQVMQKKGWHNLQIRYHFQFVAATVNGNKAAAEFFFQKLNHEEKEASLLKAALGAKGGDVICFLLSEMEEETKIKAFKSNPYRLLNYFLKWPLQCYFIEAANYVWDVLSKWNYDALLRSIDCKTISGYNDWNYRKLFENFWQNAPDAFKSFITDEYELDSFLFMINDEENIKTILKDVSSAIKKKLIYLQDFCYSLISVNHWNLLAFLLQECLTSEEEILKFKKHFKKFGVWDFLEDESESIQHKWDQLFNLSVGSICNNKKRILEEDESSSMKKHCSQQ